MERESVSSTSGDRAVTGRAGNPPGQGPFIHLSLRIVGDFVTQASYETYQCPGSVACGKAISEMVAGKRVAEARAIKHADLVNRVGPLPAHRQHCYGLTLLALADALRQLSQN